MDEWKDRWVGEMDRLMGGQMTGWKAGQTDRQVNEWTVGQINGCP